MEWLSDTARARTRALVGFAMLATATLAHGQIPDLVDALDAGGRAMGMGGSANVTNADTLSILNNPAGLGFVTSPTFGLTFRNLPSSSSSLSGSLNDPDFETDLFAGKQGIAHFGITYPLRFGTLGVSYQVAGFLEDERSALFLEDGALQARNYREATSARTEFLTLGLGRMMRGGSMTAGIGVIFAQRKVDYELQYELFDQDDNSRGIVDNSASGTLNGIGVVAGVQFVSGRENNLSVGVSVRSPIDLSGDEELEAVSSKIPGKASIGVALRSDEIRGNQDYLVTAAQVDYYFGASNAGLLGIDDGIGFGIGVEYNLHRFGGRIPVRLGYMRSPARGSGGFDERSAVTFGVGYRPNNGRWGVDLSLATPEGGQYDLALAIVYRLGDEE